MTVATTLALPLRMTGRRFATLPQGDPVEVGQSVALLLATRPGERRSVPGYGLPDPLFASRVDVGQVADVVAEWEDRADTPTVTQAFAAVEASIYSAATGLLPDQPTIDVVVGFDTREGSP